MTQIKKRYILKEKEALIKAQNHSKSPMINEIMFK